MIIPYITKKKKLYRGFVDTYIKNKGKKYFAAESWDERYSLGVSDKQTISQNHGLAISMYHYCSVELQILKHVTNFDIDLENKVILDIGSGSGHWISFYENFNVKNIIGVEISNTASLYLKEKFSEDKSINIINAKAIDIKSKINNQVDLISAIGVMFHIVDDEEWKNTIINFSNILSDNGLFIIGGHFGLINGLNVQIDKNENINKRLRSKKKWKKTLKEAGFKNVYFYKNNAYLHVNNVLPENNILIATK